MRGGGGPKSQVDIRTSGRVVFVLAAAHLLTLAGTPPAPATVVRRRLTANTTVEHNWWSPRLVYCIRKQP